MNYYNMKHINIMPRVMSTLFVIIISLLVFTSCRKDIVDEFTPISERWKDLDQFLGSIDLSNSFSIPSAESEFVIEIGESTLHFHEKTFVDDQNQLVTGPISLKITKVNSSGEVIMNSIFSSTTVDEVLYSESLLYIEATSQGEKVNFSIDAEVYVYVKSNTVALNSEATFDWFSTSGTVGWFPTVNFNLSLHDWDFYNNGINYKGSGYKVVVQNEGWLHLGLFEDVLYPDDNQYGELSITVPTEFDNNDTKVYLAYKDKISSIELEKIGNVFKSDRVLKSVEMDVILLSTLNDELYFGNKHIVTGLTNDFTINPTQMNYVEVFSQLKKI